MSASATGPHEARLPARLRASGQSLVETVIALSIVVMIVFGLIHLSLLVVSRHVCNFAAFSGARASVYGGTGDQSRAQEAARVVTGFLPSGTRFLWARPSAGRFRVQIDSPFGYPLTGPGGHAIVSSAVPMYVQPPVPEVGDNASR
jgi:hypothetical protein